MIGHIWEIRAGEQAESYTATERRIGRDGVGAKVDKLTGNTVTGTLEEVRAQLKARGAEIVRKPANAAADIIEIWF